MKSNVQFGFRPDLILSGIETMLSGEVSDRSFEHRRESSRARRKRLAEIANRTAAENIVGYWRNVGGYMRTAMAVAK